MNTLDKNVPLPEAGKSKGPARTLAAERTREPSHEMRAFETYDNADDYKEEVKPWVRPTSLEAPPARTGFSQRWIRVGSFGNDDPTNVSRKFREGWRPRLASTVPPSYTVPTIAHGKWAGCIGVEGMLLCEMPTKMKEKRDKHFSELTRTITEGMEADLQAQSHTAMPITQERRSKVVREVKVMEDNE